MLLVNIDFVKQNINLILFILFTKLVNCTFSHICIKLDHLKHLKCDMASKDKLEELAKCDTRVAQDYVNWTVDECRMAYRLQTKMFDCRANMPSRYRRDVSCRACWPNPAGRLEDKEETQDHLEVCGGYSELWEVLGPMTPQSRIE